MLDSQTDKQINIGMYDGAGFQKDALRKAVFGDLYQNPLIHTVINNRIKHS